MLSGRFSTTFQHTTMNHNTTVSTNTCPSCKGTAFDKTIGRITEENNTITSFIPETYRSYLVRSTLISGSIASISMSLIAHPDTSTNPLFHYVVFFVIFSMGIIYAILRWHIYRKAKVFAEVFICKTCGLYICLPANMPWPKDIKELRHFAPVNIRSLEKFHHSITSKNKKHKK
jgi:hypothetical protein